MTLQEFTENLKVKNQIKLATELIEIGLPSWVEYVNKKPIEYIDSVIAMEHKVDNGIISRVIELSKKINSKPRIYSKRIYKSQLDNLYDEIREPIVALEDYDFELPENVKLILFSAYNLTEYLNGKKKSSLNENLAYISINQSIDSITKSEILDYEQVNEILNSYKKTQGNNV